MAFLHLDALPPKTTKGTIVRLVIQLGNLDRNRIGAIEVRGRAATVEVPDAWGHRLAKAIDGTNLANRLIRAWCEAAGDGSTEDDHLQHLMRLLDLEGVAEAEQVRRQRERLSPGKAEQSGLSLINLTVRDQEAGLGGRYILELCKRGSPAPRLPWSRLGIGSPIVLSERDQSETTWRGVISNRFATAVKVALNIAPEFSADNPVLRLDLANDEIGRQRQRVALQRARGARGDRSAMLRDSLLGERPPAFDPLPDLEQWQTTLNEAQRAAVQFGLAAKDVAVIHGPPGTGKTTTIVELIRQSVAQDNKVLVCAPSNLAVDNVFERLLAAGEKAVRLGHPARVLPELRKHTLDLLVDRHEDVRLARKLVREAFALREKAGKHTRAKPVPGARREMRDEAKQLISDARRLEAQVVQHILDQSTILCATLTGMDSDLLGKRAFDLAVVDEACQATEPACWIPVLRCDRIVLAGDHCQLPPTVVSRDAARQGFNVSMLERIVHRFGNKIAKQLCVQYRMHRSIMDFSSDEFYDGTLVADDMVAQHLLSDLPGVENNAFTATPLHFIDTAGAGYDEQIEPDGESRMNEQEAALVVRKVKQLLEMGVSPDQVAVISPYAAQVRLLRKLLEQDDLETDTVDGFQGREKEAVVISLVRSNSDGEIGFLADVRRMNVALTRARRKLLVVGDSATIANHTFYQRLLEYFELMSAYHTVWEE
ncbi:MAG TPA: IGHMBP2 family helicase [Pirellulaceae bacterium]|nr:IGHMBP2 family helicase [Pirellulaceae bacterium]